MKPAFEKLGTNYEASSVVIGDSDCTASGKELCERFSVSGYPTIKYFKDGDKDGADYSGGRSYDDLEKFVKDELEAKCDVKEPADCTDKEKRPPGDHVDSPPEAATTAAPDRSSAFAALDMDTCGGVYDGGGDSSRSPFSSASTSTGNDKDAAVPLPVVESMLAKLRGAAEALAKRMRGEASEYAEG